MYISAILLQAKPGHAADVGAAATEIGGMMTSAGAEGVATWNAIAGASYGSFVVSARFDSLAGYMDGAAKVQSDPAFKKLSKELSGSLHVPAETQLNRIVTASPTYSPRPFVGTTSMVIAAGQFSAAMTWCTEFLEFAEQVTGHGGVLTKSAGGRVGLAGFIFSADDAGQWEELEAKLLADPGYIARMDQLGGLFEPGSDLRVLMTQIA